jgi:hypothetical protein
MEEVDADWRRILDFFRAFVPVLPLELPGLDLVTRKRALRRFKPHAARGVDGIPIMIFLLYQTPGQSAYWSCWATSSSSPQAIFLGVVSVIAKDAQASIMDRFRPLVIFSIICRTWASLRSRQLLRALSPYTDCEAYVFLPGCKAAQLWTILQGEVECSLQGAQPLCGLSTDLIRAFNNIPRQHIFALAQHLGVPSKVLQPWRLDRVHVPLSCRAL